MDLAVARRLLADLPEDAVVVDVGGGASPFPRADYVIDAVSFDASGSGSSANVHEHLGMRPRFTRDSWIQADVCARSPWPVVDKQFDFVVCSHLLEDIRDPIWACSELQRIGKAGYIEVPSRIEEQCRGVEHPSYAGYYHHRWLIGRNGDKLEFRHKPHNLHAINDAIVAQLAPGLRINPVHSILSFEWTGAVLATEVLEFSEAKVIDELCSFAAAARVLPDLTVRVPMNWRDNAKRRVYFWRLAHGRR
jgi:hypothetical protein